MNNRALAYQTIGKFVLFRKLEEGALSDLWRGCPLDASSPTVLAIHRFKGGDPVALRDAAAAARTAIRQTAAATIVRDQAVEIAAGTPILVHEYSGGRSLRGVVERAARPASPHPVPLDQSLAITERIAASLVALHSMRAAGSRLVHGAVIPQFVWITEDGEVRLAGHHLARGVVASLRDRTVRAEIGAFFAPELRDGGEPSVAGDIYSAGAILHLTLTGKPPAEAPESLSAALEAATLQFDDEPIPPSLRGILEKTLCADPSQRFGSYEDLHRAVTRIASGGEYAPTTFNLAFYLHTLMKKEKEDEADERRREESADLAALAARAKEDEKAAALVAAPAAPPAAAAAAPSSPLSHVERPRSRAPLIAAAALLLVAAGVGALLVLRPRTAVATPAAPAPMKAAIEPPVAAPILTALAEDPGDAVAPEAATAEGTVGDEEARRRAFEDEVNRRLQAEVARLQAEYEKQLAAERAKPAARPAADPPQQTARSSPAPPPAPAADLASADRLNQQRLDQLRETAASPAVPPVETAASLPRDTVESPTAAEPPAVPAIREGDLIELAALDRPPSIVRTVAPDYPPLARRQKLGAIVIVSALITETGDVAEVRVLRGDSRKLGFDEAAVAAVRQAKFSPPLKDGKRVRTWMAMPVNFEAR